MLDRIRKISSWVGVSVFIVLIRGYQFGIRPLLIGQCKFIPSCSEYAVEALRRHGCTGGLKLAMGRLLRCHPFSTGGIDPVPDPSTKGREREA